MQDITIDAKDYLTGPINKRALKLCQKLEESTQENKKFYFAKIIQECEYNQTTNKRDDSNKVCKGKKQVRKKTSEELKLLEYFLEQDPDWTRTTVATAAKVLGLTWYQVYKWGYDRKNRKETRSEGVFVRNIEVDKEMIDKINKLKDQTKNKSAVNLNKQVDELLMGSSKYKNLDENWAEFPMDELNFLSDQACSGDSSDENVDMMIKMPQKRISKVFKVQRVQKRSKNTENEYDMNHHDHLWHGWHNSSSSNFGNFNQDINLSNYQEGKVYEADLNERQSVITNDKSNASVIIKNEYSDKLSQICDNSPFGR